MKGDIPLQIRLRGLLYALCLALVLTTACSHNAGIQTQTPAQRVAVYNSILADSTHAITQTCIGLQKSGTLSAAQTAAVLDYLYKIAAASQAIALLQKSDRPWSEVAPQIQALLVKITPPGDTVAALTTSVTAIMVQVQAILVEVRR
jgi:hypothetical protein